MSAGWGRSLQKLIVAGMFLAALASPHETSAEIAEYALKAEFIERFARFVEWPDQAFPSADASFVICIVGDNPFGDYLDRLASERQIKNRHVSIKYIAARSDFDSCHIAFIAASERERVTTILARTMGKPILTIGDTPGFAQAGALINFYRVDDLLRFEINLDEVKRSGLKFSSNLMRLGRIVGTGEK
jgi:hypothetical protein